MSQVTHQAESTGTGRALYMALELSAAKWHVVFGVGMATAVGHRTMAAGSAERLREEVRRARERFGLPAEAAVRSCYEAGRDGFGVHRFLTQEGIENLVVDSSSIEVDRRQGRATTDRLDGTRLFRTLVQYWSGDRDTWKVVHVPSEALEDGRQLERGIATLTAERTTWRNRIHALLMLAGVLTSISADLGERLETLRTWARAPLPPGLVGRLGQAWRMLRAVEDELRAARVAQAHDLAAAATAPARTTASGLGPARLRMPWAARLVPPLGRPPAR